MTIYVDELPSSGWGKWNRGAHMLTTNMDELHAMARRIGLRREWFQDRRIPHYDLTASKRRLAITHGAVEIELGELPFGVLIKNRDGTYRARTRRAPQIQRVSDAV